MKIITQAKPKKKLSAFFDQFTDKDIKARTNAEAEKQTKLVSAAIHSSHPKRSFKNNGEMAQFEADTLHEVLNKFISAGISFDVSVDDFQTIDGANALKTSDREFLRLNGAAILCHLQQSLLVKHLFNHSLERFEDFAFEIREREALLTTTLKTEFEKYLEAVRLTTRRWFCELLEKGEG
jgi:hypothetical protein